MRLKNYSLLLIGVAAIAPMSQAWAQATDTGATAVSQTDDEGLGDIIVTAQRRDESLQKAPVAVQVFSQDALRARGATTILDLPQLVPGLTINSNGPYAPISLRGVSSNRPSGSVLTFIDGVYQPYNAGITQFVTVSGIEVDKGPQGTLFGRNSTGGIVQITTRKPSSEFGGQIEAGYANYDTISGNGYLTGGFGDSVATDIATYYSDRRDGWGVNRATGKDVFTAKDFGVRNKWNIQASDVTSFEVIGDYTFSRTDLGANITQLYGTRPLYNPLTRSTYTLPGKFDVNSDSGPVTVTRQGGVSLKAETQVGGVILRNITAWRKLKAHFLADQDSTPVDFLHADIDIANQSVSNEFQISSANPTWLTWVAGIFYFHDKEDTNFSLGGLAASLVFGAPPGQSFDVKASAITDAIAGYGQVSAEIVPGTKVTIGARYTSDKRSIEGESRFVGATVTPVPGTAGRQEKTFDKFTYRVVLDHQFTPDILGYASYSTGFSSGSFNQLSIPGFNDVVNPPIKPETIKAAEVGLKTSFFDNRLRVNLSAFHYRYNDLQLQVYKFGNITTVNAAGAKIQGLDVDVTARPVRNLSFSVSAEYLDAKYTSYPSAPVYVTCPSSITLTSGAPACDATRGNGELINLLLSDTTLNGGRGANGNRAINAPRYSINGNITHTLPTGIGEFLTSLSVSYRGTFYADAANIYPIRAVTLLNASERLTLSDGQTYIQGFVNNITNRRYDGFVNFTTPVGVFGNPAAPRTYGLIVGTKF